jgi:serine/threonine protein kinase
MVMPGIGTRIAHYEVLGVLGGGYKSVVFMARDLTLRRPVAIKVLRNNGRAGKQRFIREARAIAAIDHPNICTIHDFSDPPDGGAYIVMPYYAGTTLRARIDPGPLSSRLASHIALQLTLGLEEAHNRGVVHGDLTPNNVIVTANQTVKLIDFDVSRLPGELLKTRGDRIVGTPAYMSPEQARARVPDNRSDIWSVGVVLYEMLTALLPRIGTDDRETLRAVRAAGPIDLKHSGIPAPLRRVLLRALARLPRDRYQTAGSMAFDIHRFLSRHNTG